MVDPAVVEVGNVQCVVGPEVVRVDDAVRFHLLVDDRQQGLRPGVWNDRHVDFAAALEQAKRSDLGCGAAPAPALGDTAEITKVDRYRPLGS